MDFYFDIEFIKELQVRSDDSDVFIDFKRFLKQLHCSNIFLFIESHELTVSCLIDNPLLKYISDSSPFITLEHSDLNKILNNDNASAFKCFFLNSIDVETIRKQFGYFALSAFEIIKNDELFNAGRQDLIKVTSNEAGENKLDSWSILKDYKYPINSVVINDRYFLNNKKSLNINILSLLDNIGLIPLKNRKIDICIITEEIFKKRKEEEPYYLMNENFCYAYTIISNHLNSLIGSDSYNLTVLRVDKNTTPQSFELHQRILVTNFLVIDSVPSFSFFERNKDGKISVRVQEKVSFDFILWKRSRNTLVSIINNMKEAFLKIEDLKNTEGHILKKRVISKNRTCRLFFD